MNKMNKFTKNEKSWMFYDWANSVYATNILAAIFPIYFATVCQANGKDGIVLLSLGTSIATFCVAIFAPFLGALGSHKGYKKKLFASFLVLGVVAILACAIVDNYMGLLIGFIISHIGYSGTILFYDSFLTDVTTDDRMDKVSSWGYAMGYLGGSTIPFVASIAILLVMGMDNLVAIKITILITAVWWLVFSIPILKNVKQIHYVEKPTSSLIISSLSSLVETAKAIFSHKKIFYFLLAYFFYIDGVSTIISISTAYGTILGLDTVGMILALMVTQIVAVPCSILFGKFAMKYGSIKLIKFGILVYAFICGVGFFMGFIIEQNPNSQSALQNAQILFWILAFMVGTVQGGIQAISRSYFGKLVPPDNSSEYFGFFDIFGKFAAVLGPLIITIIKTLTGSDALSVLSLVILFVAGFVFISLGSKYFEKTK